MYNIEIQNTPFLSSSEDFKWTMYNALNAYKIIVLYHKNCNDGFVSAMVAQHYLQRAVCVPVQYNEALPKEVKEADGDTVLIILDFSFPHDVLNELADKFRSVFVLDHHKTFIDQIKKVDESNVRYNWLFSSEENKDTWVSGAKMTYLAFATMLGEPLGVVGQYYDHLVELTSRHDTWKHNGDHTDSAFKLQTGLMSLRVGSTDAERLKLACGCMTSSPAFFTNLIIDSGAAIIEDNIAHIKKTLKSKAVVKTVQFQNQEYLVAYCELESKYVSLASQFYHEMFPGIDFNASLDKKERPGQDPVWVWSLRTANTNVPLGDIAKAQGGGGHSQAAAFSLAVEPKSFELI